MASKTLLRNISGVDDVRAALSNSTLRRLLSIGTNWTKVRVGIRFSIVDTGADLTSTPMLAMGVCAGITNAVNNGSATTDNFVGMRTTATSWTRNAGPPPYYLNGAYTVRAAKRVGTTWGYTAGTNNFWYAWYIPTGTGLRQMLCVDVTKGSPNFTINMFARGNNSPQSDITKEDFLGKVALADPGNWNGHYMGTPNTVAVNEATNGYLNAVNVAWDRSTPKLEISDLAVVRFA